MLIMCGTALDFFCFCGFCAVFETANTFAIRIMPHTIRPERTGLARAEAYFLRLVCYTVQTLGTDSFERT